MNPTKENYKQSLCKFIDNHKPDNTFKQQDQYLIMIRYCKKEKQYYSDLHCWECLKFKPNNKIKSFLDDFFKYYMGYIPIIKGVVN